ncbi:MAG: hypothetical protein AAGA03_06960 [Planctomycetota bacterium]
MNGRVRFWILLATTLSLVGPSGSPFGPGSGWAQIRKSSPAERAAKALDKVRRQGIYVPGFSPKHYGFHYHPGYTIPYAPPLYYPSRYHAWYPPGIYGPGFHPPYFGPVFGGPVFGGPNIQVQISSPLPRRVPWPQSTIIDVREVPNPRLPPARLTMFNGGPRTIEVTVLDEVDPQGTQRFKLGRGEGRPVTIQRDSGGTRIRTVETFDRWGYPVTQEYTSVIPPASRYEVVVHEWAIQSIAIDRTGKSPNMIEDINRQGKGLGRFLLPPGDQLRSGRIDVYRQAKSMGNQGTVTPLLDPERSGQPRDNASVIERQLEAIRRQQSR